MRYLIAALTAIAMVVHPGAVASGDGGPEVEWVKEHAIPFDTQVAGSGFDDLAPPPAESVESVLAATGEPRLILDLRGDGAEWLAEPVKMRSIGAMAMEPEQQFYFITIPDAFDVLVYFENTTAAIPIGGRD